MAGSEIDGATFARARRGDERAFADLVRHYDEGLRALAFRIVGDRDRMDDAMQDAYVRAFRALPRFRGESAPGTWLYRITYNACIDELKRTRPSVPLEEAGELPDTRPGIPELLSTRNRVAAALAQLSPADRAAVLLVDAQGFDYGEAAGVLGVPAGTVASRLNRARTLLRRALDTNAKGAGGR
jgi:RNA polymerase sigma-70 factor (ECF subfamily)